MISLDSETTGVDLRHGAKPFLVTTCDKDQNVTFWEWDVDPLTRQPEVPEADLEEVKEEINQAESLVLQNPKFDVMALCTIDDDFYDWDWSKTYDTLFAGHLLASSRPHDLTTMALTYLSVNIKPYEEAVKKECDKARRWARSHRPDWRIAKKGLEEMPSAKETVWKNDMWLPRAILKDCASKLQFIVGYESEQQPTVVSDRDCDIRITRPSKWGNPFKIGRDGNRSQVVQKYAAWLWKQPNLLADLPELYGKRLGCVCGKKRPCHGDVLRLFCHPWMTVTGEYANADSAVTLPLLQKMLAVIDQRDLRAIYEERLKLLPIIFGMEERGVTLSHKRLDELTVEYLEESGVAEETCVGIAEGLGHELSLPKSGNNKSLTSFVNARDGLDLIGLHDRFDASFDTSVLFTDTGSISLNKDAIDHYISILEGGDEYDETRQEFLSALRNKRKRDTALTYMNAYKRFMIPSKGRFYVLHPSLNPTGTFTLRWSSSNPNEQNISKQEGFNLRYCFGPEPGREWWSLDAKNIELRLPAYESGEEEMIALFERPDDPPYFGSNHLLVFSILHPDKWDHDDPEGLLKAKKEYASTWYQWVKNGNFAVQYGAIEASGTADRAYHYPGGQRLIQERFKNIAKLNQSCIRYAEQFGYVETIPDKTVDPHRGYPLMCTRTSYGRIKPTVPLNYHIQGTAMWWMSGAMVRIQPYLQRLSEADGLGYHMVMQVHDELVFDFPYKANKGNLPKIRKIKNLMEQGGSNIGIPTPVSIEYHRHTWDKGETVE